MSTHFDKLNVDWDAEPNRPEPKLNTDENGLTLTFFLNPSTHPPVRDYDRGEVFFPNCWRYRLGGPNDEGWHKGHCRFCCWAPNWGDFYEVTGDLLDDAANDWVVLHSSHAAASRHFLFYFKDETFECDAENWSFKVVRVLDADYEQLRASEIEVPLGQASLSSLVRDLAFEPFLAVKRWLRK